MIKAVIMAGASGTMLWPLSRAGHSNQSTYHGKEVVHALENIDDVS